LWLSCLESSADENRYDHFIGRASKSKGSGEKYVLQETEDSVSKYMTRSKAMQMSDMQQTHHKDPHPGQAVTLKHEDISRRAYEIYVENGCKEGQSEQNWRQAEQELKNQEEWQEADKEIKTW